MHFACVVCVRVYVCACVWRMRASLDNVNVNVDSRHEIISECPALECWTMHGAWCVGAWCTVGGAWHVVHDGSGAWFIVASGNRYDHDGMGEALISMVTPFPFLQTSMGPCG